eukprot:10027942-Alexandrium_andersonii.AAC.1
MSLCLPSRGWGCTAGAPTPSSTRALSGPATRLRRQRRERAERWRELERERCRDAALEYNSRFCADCCAAALYARRPRPRTCLWP